MLDHRNGPATITANDDGTEFKVSFAPDSRSRLLKLVVLKNEGAVPALNKIVLTGADGARLLPVGEDFASLNKNDTLEILTGDKISVRYVDDRFVTEAKERLERFLDVAFTNARAEFADMEHVVRVVRVADAADGRLLQVVMDAEADKALGFLAKPQG